MTTCFITGREAVVNCNGGWYEVYCPRAGGKYKITLEASQDLATEVQECLDLRQKAIEFVTRENLAGGIPAISTEDMDKIRETRLPAPAEAQERLLRHFASQQTFVSDFYKLPSTDELEWALCAAGPYQDINFHLEALGAQGLLELKDDGQTFKKVRLTTKAHEKLAAVRPGKSKQAFVAMWFGGDSMRVYEQGIAPAVRDAGFDPLRIDKTEHIDKIDDRIVAEIKRSRFLVADFTCPPGKPRGGVYYEAGLAHGLGMPVIWTCNKASINDLHFDTRQYNHIDWTTAEELRSRLLNRILAVVGEGPLSTRSR